MAKHDELAMAVENELTKRSWSLRAAQAETGISFSVIDRMRNGTPVELSSLIKWSMSISTEGRFSETILKYVRMSDMNDAVNMIKIIQHEAISDYISVIKKNESDPLDLEFMDSYRSMSGSDRELIKGIAKRLAMKK